jgi:hypothetical protein
MRFQSVLFDSGSGGVVYDGIFIDTALRWSVHKGLLKVISYFSGQRGRRVGLIGTAPD